DAQGTETSQITNLTAGGSQQILFNPSATVSQETLNYTGINGEGVLTSDTINNTNGTSQIQAFNVSPDIAEITSEFSGLNGAGVLTSTATTSTSGVTVTEQAPPGQALGADISLAQTSVQISDQYKQANPQAQQLPSDIQASQIGQILGSQLGQAL